MKEILIINGSGGVGKDTFVSFLGKYAKVNHISIVDLSKTLARGIGWKGEKTEKDRKFLSDLKHLIDDYNDKNYCMVQKVMKKFTQSETDIELLCIDMREKNQIERAKKEFGAKTVLITNKRVAPITSNSADANVNEIEYDYTIANNGTLDELDFKAQAFIELLKQEEKTPFAYEKTVYISHPYGGKNINKRMVELLILSLMKSFPKIRFVSGITSFGFKYFDQKYEQGLDECLWLLNFCDEMWVFGDYENSKGCLAEIEFCKEKNKPFGHMIVDADGNKKLAPLDERNKFGRFFE